MEETAVSRARSVVMRHGHNPTAYQTLNPGFEYFFPRVVDGYVAYARSGRVWVAAGAPVCAAGDLRAAMGEFEAEARRAGCYVCYVAVTDRLRKLVEGVSGYARVTLGGEPVWDPREWAALVKAQRSIRAQINRARNKGVAAGERAAMEARTDAGMRRVLVEWLGTKNLPPMAFLNSGDPAAGPLEDRLLFAAEREGEVLAFLLASPVPGRNGFLVEQLARSPRAPNGTAELLIDCAMRGMAARECSYVTLGLVPLSTHVGSYRENPLWLRPLVAWARAHGRRFYNFDGLEAFRVKLHPAHWEPLYAIANRPRFPAGALYAMGAVTFNASPVPVFAKALVGAVGEEARRWRGDRRREHESPRTDASLHE